MAALAALAAVALTLAAWAWDRRQRSHETQQLLAAAERERELWHRERQLLLNRIRPETAQYVPQPLHGPVVAPPAPQFDDDEDWWRAVESKEELAERAMRAELEARQAPAIDEAPAS